jgi:hypothetical protein
VSRASATVRLPNGETLHGLYNGTNDTLWPLFVGSSREAWDLYEDLTEPRCKGVASCDVVPVDYFTDYGFGQLWTGLTFCTTCSCLVRGAMECPDEMEGTSLLEGDDAAGLPGWRRVTDRYWHPEWA